MTTRLARLCGAWAFALVTMLSTTASAANEVLFENVRVFDGKSAALSAPSNVLVEGTAIKVISTAPIEC